MSLEYHGRSIELFTADRVFSHKRIDKGTLLLIDHMDVGSGDTVLDLGCGYGPISVCSSLRGGHVVGIDINARAAWLARENMARHAVSPWAILVGDLYSPLSEGTFDSILCNPPIRAGRESVSRIIREARKYLRNDGSLQIVARTRMGAKTLSSIMEESFGNVAEAARQSGYRVLKSRCRGGRVD